MGKGFRPQAAQPIKTHITFKFGTVLVQLYQSNNTRTYQETPRGHSSEEVVQVYPAVKTLFAHLTCRSLDHWLQHFSPKNLPKM